MFLLYIRGKKKVFNMLTPIQMKGLTELQQGFKKIFLRDIDLGETYVMAQRYKDIEKIADRSQYVDAMFKETKNNFGFRNSKIKLELEPAERLGIGVNGAADNAFLSLKIRENLEREKVAGTIHHEFRHFLQDFFAFNQSPKEYMQAVNKKIEIMTKGKVKNIWKDLDKFKKWISENMGIAEPSTANIPSGQKFFTMRCINGTKNYIPAEQNFRAYKRNFLEQDAYETQDRIQTLLDTINKGIVI